jgi:hypothetical protein
VAGQTFRDADATFRLSRRSSIAVFWSIIPMVALVATLLCPSGSRALAASTAIGVTSSGLSIAWFTSARGRTSELAIFEIAPRLLCLCCSAAVVVLAGRSALWTYPAALAAAGLSGPYFYARGRHLAASPEVPTLTVIVRQRTPAFTAVLGTVYSSLAIPIVALVAAAEQVASLSSAYRLYVVGLSSILIITQATSSWGVAKTGAQREELRIAGTLYAVVGAAGMVVFASAGPILGTALFGANHTFDRPTAFGFGLAFLAVALHTFANTHLLLPFSVTHAGLHATVAGVAVGVPCTAILAGLFGAGGAAAGIAVAEVTVTACLGFSTLMHRRRRSLTAPNECNSSQSGPESDST